MVRAVNHGCPDVDHGETSNHTGLAGLLHAGFCRTDVLLGNDATNNFIDEFESCAWLAWLHFDHHVAVLTFATSLTSIFSFPLGAGANGFAIGHLRSADICLDIKFAQHPIHQDFKVEFSHASNNCLAGFWIGGDPESGVFF